MDNPGPVLFTQAGCADNAKVRDWLTEHGVAFTERVVTGDEGAALHLLATGVFGTPLLVVDNTKVLGFRPPALMAALGLAGDDEGSNGTPLR